MRLQKSLYILLIIIATYCILIYAKEFIIPVLLSVVLWYIIRETSRIIGSIAIGNFRLPRSLCLLLALVFILAIIGLIINIIISNCAALLEQFSTYEKNLNNILGQLDDYVYTDVTDVINSTAQEINFKAMLSALLSALYGLVSNAFMVILYTMFLLVEAATIPHKLKKAYPSTQNLASIHSIFSSIDKSLSRYLRLKTVVSLATGTASYLVLEFFIGIDSAFFWSLLIFVLNFIPTVGSLVATLFPTIFSLMQFGNFSMPLITLLLIGGLQIIIGNVLEPKLVGRQLNVSPLVMIISLALWGMIWGIVGMLLSVPITIILIVLFSEFPSTKRIAIFMQGYSSRP